MSAKDLPSTQLGVPEISIRSDDHRLPPFSIERVPPVEAKSADGFVTKKWVIYHILTKSLEERNSSADNMHGERTRELPGRYAALFLLEKGYLRLQETNWGKDSSGKRIILTTKGWQYGDVKEAAAINVAEEFELKKDEERLMKTFLKVWDVDKGQCFEGVKV